MITSQPPAAALAWAAETAGPDATAHTVRRLLGGAHAATHLLETDTPAREMILRRFPPGDSAAVREAHILTALDGLDGWAPRLLAADPEGKRFGEPATLISRLPGRSDITSTSPELAALQLGRALAGLHDVPLDGLTGRTGLRNAMESSTTGPAWADALGAGGPLASLLASCVHRLTEAPAVLTHFDFWSGNVLWQGDELTGIVDWSGAALAPRGFDVSWCRLDLALLHGPGAAELFLNAYQEAAGQAVPDAVLWDLFALAHSQRSVETWVPNYHDLGRTDLSAAELRRRHTAWTDNRLAA